MTTDIPPPKPIYGELGGQPLVTGATQHSKIFANRAKQKGVEVKFFSVGGEDAHLL
jgi:hypothetical protein